jgi:hypothetical protein
MWIIQELEFIGKEKCARSLEAYWNRGDVSDLVDILEAARLPDPMPGQ